MDIGISSNFERYLFELLDHDASRLNALMSSFSSTGKFEIEGNLLDKAKQDFSAYRLDDRQTARDIKSVYKGTGEVIDPHSIIGVSAARQEGDTETPTVVLGTAHPAKFPEAIKNAIGIDVPLTKQAGNLFSMKESYADIENNPHLLKQLIADTL